MGGGGTCTQKNSLIWQARQRLESCTGRTPGESVAQLFYLAVWRLSSGVIAAPPTLLDAASARSRRRPGRPDSLQEVFAWRAQHSTLDLRPQRVWEALRPVLVSLIRPIG